MPVGHVSLKYLFQFVPRDGNQTHRVANHPYGVRGVAETSIVPPLAAIGNAVSNAVGVRLSHIPMSPPRILAALDEESAS